eukprot:g12434.t1
MTDRAEVSSSTWYLDWRRHLYLGLEGDTDCSTWYNPDSVSEYALEVFFTVPLLYVLWSKAPSDVFRKALADAGSAGGKNMSGKTAANKSTAPATISGPTLSDALVAFLIFLPLPYLFQQRYESHSIATMGHACHVVLVCQILCLVLPVGGGGAGAGHWIKNLFGTVVIWLLQLVVVPLSGAYVPPLVKPDWRGWSERFNYELWPGGLTVNLYTLSFIGEHLGMLVANMYILFFSRFSRVIFRQVYATCGARFMWNSFLAGYGFFQVFYTVAARLLQYNIGYQLCPPEVIKPVAVKMLKLWFGGRFFYERFPGPVDWHDHPVDAMAAAEGNTLNKNALLNITLNPLGAAAPVQQGRSLAGVPSVDRFNRVPPWLKADAGALSQLEHSALVEHEQLSPILAKNWDRNAWQGIALRRKDIYENRILTSEGAADSVVLSFNLWHWCTINIGIPTQILVTVWITFAVADFVTVGNMIAQPQRPNNSKAMGRGAKRNRGRSGLEERKPRGATSKHGPPGKNDPNDKRLSKLKQKQTKQRQKLTATLEFNVGDRARYITGFRKRKVERQSKAQRELAEKKREEKLVEKRENRERVVEEYEQMSKAVSEAIEKFHGTGRLGGGAGGINGKEQEQEDKAADSSAAAASCGEDEDPAAAKNERANDVFEFTGADADSDSDADCLFPNATVSTTFLNDCSAFGTTTLTPGAEPGAVEAGVRSCSDCSGGGDGRENPPGEDEAEHIENSSRTASKGRGKKGKGKQDTKGKGKGAKGGAPGRKGSDEKGKGKREPSNMRREGGAKGKEEPMISKKSADSSKPRKVKKTPKKGKLKKKKTEKGGKKSGKAVKTGRKEMRSKTKKAKR